jgi:hypothetical protein
VHDIKVIFVDEPDDSNPLGIKGQRLDERCRLWSIILKIEGTRIAWGRSDRGL